LNIEADRSIKHSDYKCPTKVGTIYKLWVRYSKPHCPHDIWKIQILTAAIAWLTT